MKAVRAASASCVTFSSCFSIRNFKCICRLYSCSCCFVFFICSYAWMCIWRYMQKYIYTKYAYVSMDMYVCVDITKTKFCFITFDYCITNRVFLCNFLFIYVCINTLFKCTYECMYLCPYLCTYTCTLVRPAIVWNFFRGTLSQ